ncbi:MAG: hypothetical protein Q9190_000334 [Brigantiaea leucoxantha]
MSDQVKTMSQPCVNCLKEAWKHCKQCGFAWYCSASCQKTDWPYHKTLCLGFRDLGSSPSPQHVKAILFPEERDNPEAIWVENNGDPQDETEISQKWDVKDLLKVQSDCDISPHMVIPHWSRYRKSSFQIVLLLRTGFLTDGSKPNQSIGMVTKGNFHFSWRGPIVAVKVRYSASEEAQASRNITVLDMRDTFGFLEYYGQYAADETGNDELGPISFWWLAPELKTELLDGKQIQGVKVNCKGETDLHGKKYIPIDVAKGHPAMAFLRPCAITERLELPLIMRRYPVDDLVQQSGRALGKKNNGPQLLQINVDPQSHRWGLVTTDSVRGNVVITRKDSKDLHPNHVEALFVYLSEVILAAFNDSYGFGTEAMSREQVLEMLSKRRFEWFFQQYRAAREDDENWRNTESPYAV